MNRELVIRGVGLYAPIVVALLLWVWRWPALGRRNLVTRTGAAVLLASAWNTVALLVINIVAPRFGWWRFDAEVALIAGVPVDLYLGWITLWSPIPVLAFGSMP